MNKKSIFKDGANKNLTHPTNKKAVSLIVLVITIIVMIILAGTIILSLNSTDIMDRAEEAVEKTNLNTVQQLASMLWADAFMEGKIEQPELKAAVIDGLVANGINTENYKIVVTTKGVNIVAKWLQEGLKVKRGSETYDIGAYVTNYDETNGGTIDGLTATEWQILGVSDEGELLLLSREFVKTQTFRSGNDESDRADYLTAVNTLDAECAKYGQGSAYVTEARSIRIEDVDKITGYDKTTYGIGTVEEYGTIITYSWDGDDKPSYSYTTPTGTTGTGGLLASHRSGFWWYDETVGEWLKADYTTTAGIIKPVDSQGVEHSAVVITNYYEYYASREMDKKITNSKDTAAYKMLFRNADDSQYIVYWLASPYAHEQGWRSVTYGLLEVNSVNYDRVGPTAYFAEATGVGNGGGTSGVRAVVALSPQFNPVVD